MHPLLGYDFGDTESIDEEDILLFALGSDRRATMTWGDGGGLYFVMAPKAFAAHAWQDVRVTSTD